MKLKHALFGLVTVAAFFALVEAALWIGGVRTLAAERDPFQGFSETFRVFRLDEQRHEYRPHPAALARSFNDQRFRETKPANGFRIFVLGGSSAYGFPWDARKAFPHLLGVALQASWPEYEIEAVNAAAMSYGSHRLRILAAELLDYDPDVLVVYSGHNEFIERRFYSEKLEHPEPLTRVQSALSHLRLYSAMSRLYEGATRPDPAGEVAPEDQDAAALLGFDVQRELRVDVDDDERDEVRRLFRENLEAIVDMARHRDVPAVLCTVPSNLSGWRPNQSMFDPALDTETRAFVNETLARAKKNEPSVLADLERASGLAPGHAEVQFRLARAYESLGRLDDARAAYVRARDTDSQPARAISALNDAIRAVAAERSTPLVDIERIFERDADDGLLGFNLFEDYVHPKPGAHRKIALELWRVFQSEGLLGAVRSADPGEFERAVPERDLDANTDGPDAELDAKTPTLLYNLAIVLDNQELYDQAMEKYRACLELNPGYTFARSNLARLLSREGLYEQAAAEHTTALAGKPDHMPSILGLGESLFKLGRMDEAVRQYEQATRLDPGSLAGWRGLGLTLYAMKRHAEAEAATRRAIELAPEDVELHADLGWALFSQKEAEAARLEFDAALALDRNNSKARNGLAAVLIHEGRLGEAESLFLEILRGDPEDAYALRGLATVRSRRERNR